MGKIMVFSTKAFPLVPVAALMVAICVAGCAPTHNRVSDSKTMDDSRARLILKAVPGFDMTQVWFATGAEYWSSGTCFDGRDIEAFTKPQLSSPGIWRGKKLYVSQPTLDSKTKCADPEAFRYDPTFSITTVTFTNPDKLRLDEAWDGAEPGVFELRDGITDDELRKIAAVIDQVHSCVQKQSACPYPIDKDSRVTPSDSEVVLAVATENLLTASIDNDYENGKPCYSLVFQKGTYQGALGMDICYRNETVSKVVVGGMVIE
jgi:hypothetical protein